MENLESSISSWLREHGPSILIADPIEVLQPWLAYRAELSYCRGGSLVDLGGGVSPLNGYLAQSGMQVTVLDLLDQYYPFSTINSGISDKAQFLAKLGVRFVETDLTTVDLRSVFDRESVDVVASYHALEHLHHSPKMLLESAIDVLKPNGNLVIEVPNAANLLKRAKLLIGRTNYLPFTQFYESKRWVGHIREYTLGDLESLARSLSLRRWRITGRNWYGRLYRSGRNWPAVRAVDSLLQSRPGLCGSLFLVGQK